LGTPKAIFCLDSGTLDYDRFWLTNSLRGVTGATVRVDVLTEGVHSGAASGIVPSSFRILRILIDRFEELKTGLIPVFDIDIPAERYSEIVELVSIKGNEAVKSFPTVSSNGNGLQTPGQSIVDTVILNTWKAQLSVIGIDGLPGAPLSKAGNVLLPFTTAKLSVRLPPTYPAAQAS
jgi:hypothetical protein